MLGVAVATAVPAVGSNCPRLAARVGAIASQAWVNPYLAIDGMALLRERRTAADVRDVLIASDLHAERRQFGIVDRDGNSAAHTGSDCTPWAGHRLGDGFSVQGNMLCGEETVAAMEQVFLASADHELPERLLQALEAGDAAGGDRRGRQSAALHVVWTEEYPYVDLRVDEHLDPVAELRRVFEVAAVELLPFVRTFPTRADPLGKFDADVAAMLYQPPRHRDRI
jgi:uncharacterized Ntn-hydrolase superfamily protein